MRWLAVTSLAIFGCGSGSNPPGTLVCPASSQPGSIDVRIAVPEDGLSATRDRAKSLAKLTDCRFEAGSSDARPESLVRGRDRTTDPDPPKLDPPKLDPIPPPPIDDPPPPDDDDDVVGGVVGGPDPWADPVPSPSPLPPQNVPPSLLEGNRVSGDKNITPDQITKDEMKRDGKDRLVGSFKLCVGVDGDPASVTTLKSTGYPAYDIEIRAEMRGWKYRPWMVNGKTVPVCTAVTFIYKQ